MAEQHVGGLTRGCLPIAAFEHLDPTAVAVVDLEHLVLPSSPDGRAWEGNERDALILVRFHGEPLAVIHIDEEPAALNEKRLATLVWQKAGAEVRRHIERFACAPLPDGPQELIDAPPSYSKKCSGGQPPRSGASVAVIVCTAGRDEQLKRCLRSLLAQQGVEFEIVVVDNCPATGETLRTVSAFAAEDERVRYVAEGRVGLSVARNRGISETAAELVAFTDDDVVVDATWLAWLIAPFAQPTVAATSGMMLPLELQTEAQKRFEQYLGFSKGVKRRSYDLRISPGAGRPLYPFLVDVFGSGASMAFRRAELVAADGFDPALGAGTPARAGEETYAFSTMILDGGGIVYEPRALCWHEHHREGDDLREQVFGYGVGVGAIVAKALTREPRFYAAAARSLPIALRMRKRRRFLAKKNSKTAPPARPRDLLHARRQGIMRGPLRYAQGMVRSYRLGLRDVIRGG
jgi:O-antigen biosynthesis protein